MLALFAEAGAFAPVWSPQILLETRRAIPKALLNSDMTSTERDDHAGKVCDALETCFPQANISSITVLSETPLPDPDDQHVLDLALSAGADTIVTENLKDFPAKTLSRYGVQAINTDAFLSEIAAETPEKSEIAIQFLLQIIASPDLTRDRVLTRLKQVGLKRLARALAG